METVKRWFGGFVSTVVLVAITTTTVWAEVTPANKVQAVLVTGVSSGIGSNTKNRAKATGQAVDGSLYEAELAATFDGVGNRDDMADPIAVAEAIEHALFSETPKARYLVVPNQQEAAMTIG